MENDDDFDIDRFNDDVNIDRCNDENPCHTPTSRRIYSAICLRVLGAPYSNFPRKLQEMQSVCPVRPFEMSGKNFLSYE